MSSNNNVEIATKKRSREETTEKAAPKTKKVKVAETHPYLPVPENLKVVTMFCITETGDGCMVYRIERKDIDMRLWSAMYYLNKGNIPNALYDDNAELVRHANFLDGFMLGPDVPEGQKRPLHPNLIYDGTRSSKHPVNKWEPAVALDGHVSITVELFN